MADPQTEAMLKLVSDVIIKLHAVATELSNTLEPVSLGLESKTLMDNVKLYAQTCYVLDVAKELSRIANVVEPVIAERITKRMMAEDMEVLHFGGYSYSPDTKTYVSVAADNKASVILWLKSTPDGRELVKEDVHPKVFESFIKKRKEDGRIEDIPSTVKIFDKPTLTMRKLKG